MEQLLSAVTLHSVLLWRLRGVFPVFKEESAILWSNSSTSFRHTPVHPSHVVTVLIFQIYGQVVMRDAAVGRSLLLESLMVDNQFDSEE